MEGYHRAGSAELIAHAANVISRTTWNRQERSTLVQYDGQKTRKYTLIARLVVMSRPGKESFSSSLVAPSNTLLLRLQQILSEALRNPTHKQSQKANPPRDETREHNGK